MIKSQKSCKGLAKCDTDRGRILWFCTCWRLLAKITKRYIDVYIFVSLSGSFIFSLGIAQVSDNLLISLCEWHKIYFFVTEHRTEATPRKCVPQPTSQFCSICKSSAYRTLYCHKPSFSFESFFIRQRSSSRHQTASRTDDTSSHNRDLFGLKHVLQFTWIWIRNSDLSLTWRRVC